MKPLLSRQVSNLYSSGPKPDVLPITPQDNFNFFNIYSWHKPLINVKMSIEQIQGIVRHGLTFIGGIVVMKGLATDAVVQELIGTALTIFGLVWSIASKQK